MRDITEEMKPYIKEIVADADNDQSDAIAIITAHRLHCAAPKDPGAYGICCADASRGFRKRKNEHLKKPKETEQ